MNFLVIGESCLDVFHYGSCKRLAPAAPVPVFNSINVVSNGGMAMNVFNNLKCFSKNVQIATNKNWKSIKKTRFVEIRSNHMFMRLDENDSDYGNFDLNAIDFNNYDAVIVSDYDKGFLSTDDLKMISRLHPQTFLDTKKVLGEWSENFSFIKINGVEYERTKHLITDKIKDKLIVTKGPKGCFFKGKKFDVPLVEVKDVSGAGDTFIASFAFEFAKTKNVEKSIIFANNCATKVVQKRGVTTI